MSGIAEVHTFQRKVASNHKFRLGGGAKYCRIIANSEPNGARAKTADGRNFLRKSCDQVLFAVPATSCFRHGQWLITSGNGEYCLPDYKGETAGKANGQPRGAGNLRLTPREGSTYSATEFRTKALGSNFLVGALIGKRAGCRVASSRLSSAKD